MSVFGVHKNSGGVYQNGGEFKYPSRMRMPFFYGNDFFQLSISLSIYIKSIGNLELKVKVKTATRSYVITATTSRVMQFPKPKQTANFVHVVVPFFASTSTGSGRMNVYIDGVHKGQELTQGKILPLPGQMTLGSDSCPNPTKTNFRGYMDSVSFARTELSSTEVMDLYTSQGSCIGE
ncbi:hypothetical protein LSAT2_008874 [Lamellibrachia satsuma]|nr:hypothetical protein LSAT2_008874 [Lamellibrachia satsuma]